MQAILINQKVGVAVNEYVEGFLKSYQNCLSS